MWFHIWLLTALNRRVQSIRGALIKNLFIRQRAYVEILSTRKAWRARKRSKSCSRRSSATELDCEQSLFFFRFSKSNARARERRSRETRETRAAAREASPVSRHQSRAWPFACLAVSSTDYRKRETTRSLLLNLIRRFF